MSKGLCTVPNRTVPHEWCCEKSQVNEREVYVRIFTGEKISEDFPCTEYLELIDEKECNQTTPPPPPPPLPPPAPPPWPWWRPSRGSLGPATTATMAGCSGPRPQPPPQPPPQEPVSGQDPHVRPETCYFKEDAASATTKGTTCYASDDTRGRHYFYAGSTQLFELYIPDLSPSKNLGSSLSIDMPNSVVLIFGIAFVLCSIAGLWPAKSLFWDAVGEYSPRKGPRLHPGT